VRKNPLQRKFSVNVPSLHRDTETGRERERERESTVLGLWALECCFGFGIKKRKIIIIILATHDARPK
jgi:hypothetical protein